MEPEGAVRITGGKLRGRVLQGRAAPGVRPTSARVREALFSIVGQDLSGVRMLDAFSGSGIMAFEAWSRGADVVAVERDRRAWTALEGNARALGVEIRIVRGDVRKRLDVLGSFDLVFADPPYAEAPGPWLERFACACTGTLLFETARSTQVPRIADELRLDRSRVFGDTAVHTYRRVP